MNPNVQEVSAHAMLFYGLMLFSAGFFMGWVYFTWRKPEELHTLADPPVARIDPEDLAKFNTLISCMDKLLQSHAALEEQMKTLSTEQKGGFDGVALAIGEAKNRLLGEIIHQRHVKPAKKGKRK